MAWTVWDGQQNVTTDNYQEMKAAVARREGGSPSSGGSTSSSPYSGGSRDGGVQIEGGNASNSYSMDGASYKKYEDDYHFWQETGTYRENAEVNQDELSAWKAIHDATELGGKWGYAGGKYYTISDDAYNAYDDDYAYWQKNGKSKDEFQSNEADYNAWRTIRDTVNTTGSNIAYDENYSPWGYLDGDEATYRNEVLKRAAADWADDWKYDVYSSDPALSAEDARRQAAGEMPYYWAKSYDLTNPYEKYLYDHNLPLNQGTFRNKIASAEKKTDKEVAAYNEEVGRFNAYNEQKSDFLTKLYGHMNEVRTADRERAAAAGTNPAMLDTGGEYDLADGYTEDNPMRAEFERYAGELLTSGKYDLVAQNLSLSQDMDSKTGFDAAMAYGKESAADAKAQEKTEDNPYVFDMSQYGLTTDELYEGYLEAEAGMQAAYDAEANGTNAVNPTESSKNIPPEVLAAERPPESFSQIDLNTTDGLRESIVANYDEDAANAILAVIAPQVASLDGDIAKKQLEVNGYLRAPSAVNPATGKTFLSEKQEELKAMQEQRAKLAGAASSITSRNGAVHGMRDYIDAKATIASTYEPLQSAVDFKHNSAAFSKKEQNALFTDMSTEIRRQFQHIMEQDWDDMLRTEKQTFRYLIRTQSVDAAFAYRDTLEPVLYSRNYEKLELSGNNCASHWFTAAIATIDSTLLGQLSSAAEGFGTQFTTIMGNELKYNDPRLSQTHKRNYMRSKVASNIKESGVKHADMLSVLYTLGVSVADNAVRMATLGQFGMVGGAMSSGIMYGQVAASTLDEYLQKGASAEQAMTMSALSAACEAAGEAVGMATFLKFADAGALAKAGKTLSGAKLFGEALAMNAVTETGSEIITEILDIVSDRLVMQDRSEIMETYNALIAEGKSGGAAFWKTVEHFIPQVGMAGLGGLVSGLLIGGGSMVSNYATAGREAGAQFGKRIATGANAYASMTEAYAGLENAMPIGTAEAYNAAQDQYPSLFADAYRDALKNGTVSDPATRMQLIQDVLSLGLPSEQAEQIIRVSDAFMASPASLASPELTTSIMKFSSVLKRATDVSAKQDAAAQTRAVKAKQRLTALYDAVTTYQMAAAQAKSNGDIAGHAQAINGLSEAITKYKNALAVYQSEEAEHKIKDDIEVRDATKAVTDMAESIAATADTERAYQVERLTATIAEMVGDNTANALLHMVGELQAQESAAQPLNTEALHAEEAAAMESGDEGRYNAIQRIREAYGKGDATAYKDALDAYEAITGVNVGAAAADDTIDHIVNGGQNGAETQRADVSVSDAERGRNNDGARQRDVRREDRGGNAQSASEVAGVRGEDAGNQKTVRNRAAHEQWVEADKAGFRQKLSADINEQLGHGESLVAADDIETVDDVTPESKGYFAKAMNILGGNSPKLYRYKEGANRPVHGCAIAGREYVEYTGRTTDVFHLGHERAENTKAYRDAGFAALKAMGHYGDVVFDYYLASRGIRGIRGEQRAEMQKEFVCDMFGAYIADVALGLNLYGDLGVDDTTAREFADAFAKSMAAAAEVDGDGETEFSTVTLENDLEQKVGQRTYIQYADTQEKADAKQETHVRMVSEGKAFVVTDADMDAFTEYFPDLRSEKKSERTGKLREARKTLPSDLRAMLRNMLVDSGYKAEFDVNGDVIVAGVYNEFLDHAVSHNPKRQPSQLQSATLAKAKDIFANAEYVYSSEHDSHSDTPTSDIDHWDYFYTPVVHGVTESGVTIAVRQRAKDRGGDYQVYGWKQEQKRNGLGAPREPQSGATSVNSSAVLNATIPKTAAESNGNTEVNTKNLQFTPVAQAISSAKTSIKQVPALFTDKNAHFGKTNIDIGGGKYDLATDYLAGQGTQNMVFDPYNRMASENTETLGFLQAGSKADTATCANVLNVIAEPNARANVILEAAKAIGQDGRAYFMVYEGDGSGIGRTTSAGWQNNRKTADYVDEIGQYFGTVTRKGKLITAENPRSNLPKASWEITPGQAVEFSTNTVADPLRDADAAEAFNLYERGVSYGEYQNYPDAKPSVTKHLRGMWDKSRQIEAVREAERLYADGEDPISYYERAYKDKTYNPMVASQLRGMLIRNGQQVGGALSEGELRQLTENKENWKQLKNVRLSVTSPGRNFENLGMWRDNDIPSARAKNYEEGKRLRDNYFTFGQYQMAEKNKWMAEEGEKVRQAFGNGGTLESSIAQMLGEGMITDDDVQGARRGKDVTIVPRTDGGVFVLDKHFNLIAASDGYTTVMVDAQYRSRKEAKARAIAAIKKNASISDDKKASLVAAAQREYKAVKPQVQEYALQVSEKNGVLRVTAPTGKVIAEVANGQQADAACVTRTRDALRDFYDRALDRQNRALIENGYAPINKRNGYFPHQGRADIGVEGLISQLRDETLPTAISGETSTFRPGKPFTTHLLERLGDYTEFDATRGFDKYLAAAGDLIYSTPVIQRLRQLERTVRESEGTTNTALVSWLKEYGNLWANKKSFLDRAIEESTGRSVYTLSNKLTGLVSASAIGFNPRSALSNAISLLNSFPTLDAKRIPAAMARTIASGLSKSKDDFGTDIPFLVNRRSGYDGIQTRLSDKFKVKGSKAMYAMFEFMDYLTTETSARAKYDELRAKGYTEAEAGAKTSDYLMDVYADRTKGAAPTIFSKKSLKPIMQYQLEVMNQLFHFRDIDRQGVAEQVDRIMRDNGGTLDGIDFAAAENRIHGAGLPEIGKKLAYLLLLSAWGAVTRGLFGSDQSWNPVGMVMDAIDDYKDGGIKRAATGLASKAVDQLPLVSTLSGGRIPVVTGASNFVDAIEAIAGGNTDKALTAAGKGVLSFVPGGGQINRTIQGVKAAERGGNYTDRGRLRYPIETGADKAKSIIFGASAAAPQGYRWGEDVLSDSETEAYGEAKARGVDDFDMYDFLLTGYDSGSNTTKLLSLAAADPPKDEVDIIAEVLGIDYKGNLDRAAKSAARASEKDLKKQLKRGKIDQAAYDSKMATIDMYLAMLG